MAVTSIDKMHHGLYLSIKKPVKAFIKMAMTYTLETYWYTVSQWHARVAGLSSAFRLGLIHFHVSVHFGKPLV